jgi:hypothetical protein
MILPETNPHCVSQIVGAGQRYRPGEPSASQDLVWAACRGNLPAVFIHVKDTTKFFCSVSGLSGDGGLR